eukprot:2105879-Pleurochrysis_carterae.AAC.1
MDRAKMFTTTGYEGMKQRREIATGKLSRTLAAKGYFRLAANEYLTSHGCGSRSRHKASRPYI